MDGAVFFWSLLRGSLAGSIPRTASGDYAPAMWFRRFAIVLKNS